MEHRDSDISVPRWKATFFRYRDCFQVYLVWGSFSFLQLPLTYKMGDTVDP